MPVKNTLFKSLKLVQFTSLNWSRLFCHSTSTTKSSTPLGRTIHFLISFPTWFLACRLTRVVEDALGALLRTSPSTQHSTYWRFGAVKGALCRLEWMGATSILRAIAHVRSDLHSLVPGFTPREGLRKCWLQCLPIKSDWQTLESTLSQALPGSKGRDLKEMGRFQRGHVCTILYTIWWHSLHCAARSSKRNFLSFWVWVHLFIRINYAAPDLMCLSAWQNSSNFVLGWVSDIQSWSCLCLGTFCSPATCN